MDELPSVRNPESGWFATANQRNMPDDHPIAVTYDWYAPFRHQRIVEELGSRTGWTVDDCVRLQTDYVSLPARRILPLLNGLTSEDVRVAAALRLLGEWDATLRAGDGAAALFEIWYRRHLRPALLDAALRDLVPEERRAGALARVLPVEDTGADARVDLRLLPADPATLLSTLTDAVTETEGLLGEDMASWAWGTLHRAEPRHPLERSLGVRDWTSAGPAPRGGSGDTVGSAPYTPDFHQTGGATFRLVVDVGSWDDSVAMNAPGQSAVPGSPHHHDLFEPWAADEAFPLLYSRDAVEQNLGERIVLRPSDVDGSP
jgi:penicillin amidase